MGSIKTILPFVWQTLQVHCRSAISDESKGRDMSHTGHPSPSFHDFGMGHPSLPINGGERYIGNDRTLTRLHCTSDIAMCPFYQRFSPVLTLYAFHKSLFRVRAFDNAPGTVYLLLEKSRQCNSLPVCLQCCRDPRLTCRFEGRTLHPGASAKIGRIQLLLLCIRSSTIHRMSILLKVRRAKPVE